MPSSELEPVAPAAASGELIALLEQGRQRFLALVAHIRPELHRYCARMTGSVADGEDIVQETLARACFELSQLRELPPLRPWLFRIAHNRAIDHWRHEALRASEPLDDAADVADDSVLQPEQQLAQRQAVHAALSAFLALAPAQRGCVILRDVLEHSVEEIADALGLSASAVKAALHRGRAALAQQTASSAPPRATHTDAAQARREPSTQLRRYATLFNAHDWDGLRSMLADDVRLDLVAQRKAAGRREVQRYFSNYAGTPAWHVAPAWLEGREALAVLPDATSPRASYVVVLEFDEGLVSTIRDYRYVPYITRDAALELAD